MGAGGRGYEVVQAASGRAALEIVEALPPALILLDVHMPGMDGFGVIEALRAPDGRLCLPVILFTADDGDTVKLKARRLGVRELLVKGNVNLDGLLASVGRHAKRQACVHAAQQMARLLRGRRAPGHG